MKKRILAFFYNDDRRHSENFISKSISKVTKYYGIERKNLCLSFDNASNNKTVVDLLKVELSLMLPEIFHDKCVCHIYNSITRDVLEFLELYIEKIRLAVGFIQGNHRKIRMKEF